MRARTLRLVPLLLAALLVGRLAAVWAARATFPYDLEWMEGGMLAHAWRLTHGLPLYTTPGPDWIPYLYPPGYAALLAAASTVFGLDYSTGRALALLGTLCAAGAVVHIVARQGRSWSVALLSAAAFLGCYPQVGAFYDLVRLDGSLMGLLAWSLALALDKRRGALATSALLLAVAFTFKQNVALLGLPLAAYLWHRDGWRIGLAWGLTAAVPALAFVAWMQARTHGVFLDYLVATPAAHPVVALRVFPGLLRDLAAALAPMLAAGTAAWALTEHRARALSRREVRAAVGLGALLFALDWLLPQASGSGALYVWQRLLADGAGGLALVLAARVGRAHPERSFALGVGGVGLLMVALMRGHHGGFINVLVPGFWLVCVGAGVALARSERLGAPSWAISLALTAQLVFANAALHPDDLVPTDEDRAAGDALVAALRGVEGPVLAPIAPWLPVQAGHKPSFPLIALWDVAQHKRSPFPGVTQMLTRAAQEQHWGAVVTGPRPLDFALPPSYAHAQTFEPPAGAGYPMTGWRTRPTELLVRTP